MKITLTPKEGGTSFVFPALPEKIRVSSGASLQSYDILSLGTVSIPRGREPVEVSWDHVFFGYAKRKERIVERDYWQEPEECVKILDNWMKNGTELILMVSGGGINIDVTIETFDHDISGAYGNVGYSLSFTEIRPLQVYTTKEKESGGGSKNLKPRTPRKKGGDNKNVSREGKKTYTVAKGDTLWKIAKKMYGDGNRWIDIYYANETLIEGTAVKHKKKNSNYGNRIYAGTILVIP